MNCEIVLPFSLSNGGSSERFARDLVVTYDATSYRGTTIRHSEVQSVKYLAMDVTAYNVVPVGRTKSDHQG
jgi:hypothetical protein